MQRRISYRTRSVKQRFRMWQRRYHNAEMIRQAEVLPLHRDMVTLLTFVRDNKVVGTQSTGNMPLKAVREVTARFVNPPQLETTIGDHTYRLRSEADLWPLYFLHILAEVGDLLAIAPARRWRLTSDGEEFLNVDPLLQVSSLLMIWWYKVNWLIAFSFAGMGEALPASFKMISLARLRSLPIGAPIPFIEFADGLIEQTGLTWTVQGDFTTMLLRSSIKRMIVDILAIFGVAECKYKGEPLEPGAIRRLVTFEITPFGEALLDSIVMAGGLRL